MAYIPCNYGSSGGTMSETVLWTNPNPSSSFASQGVDVPNINNYTYIKIYADISTTSSMQSIAIFTPGQLLDSEITGTDPAPLSMIAIMNGNNRRYFRMMAASSSTSIRFTNATNGSTDNNALVIPSKITGLK